MNHKGTENTKERKEGDNQ